MGEITLFCIECCLALIFRVYLACNKKEEVMYYLIGFGSGLVLGLGVLIPSMNEHGEVSFSQLKKSYGKVLSSVNLFRIFTKY